MKSLFVIRDKTTGAFCSSAKYKYFNSDVNAASLFDSKANAEKAVRSMMSSLTKELNPYGGNTWSLTQDNVVEAFFHAFHTEYIQLLESKMHLKQHAESARKIKDAKLDLEVVEVKLTLVG